MKQHFHIQHNLSLYFLALYEGLLEYLLFAASLVVRVT